MVAQAPNPQLVRKFIDAFMSGLAAPSPYMYIYINILILLYTYKCCVWSYVVCWSEVLPARFLFGEFPAM